MLIQLNSNFHIHELLLNIATLGSTVICQIQATLPPNAPKEFPKLSQVLLVLGETGSQRDSCLSLAKLLTSWVLLFLIVSTKVGKISSGASFVISFIRLEHASKYFFLES